MPIIEGLEFTQWTVQ